MEERFSMSEIERKNAELQMRVIELEEQLRAAEDKASRIEMESQDMYENANSQLQKSLEIAHERNRQLERENGTLALALEVYRSRGANATTDQREKAPPFSPLKSKLIANLNTAKAKYASKKEKELFDDDDLNDADTQNLSIIDDEEEEAAAIFSSSSSAKLAGETTSPTKFS
uniref:Uncharacterized protein n=1 Tax=Aureoumbra lagunensis TaxID=44058 RepID=A0A7S3JYZ5_9STRA|mmetsp:Transcript_15107/g.19993  ORF Transcript_15107/g.19993 Transcript_15107/m.19993 type:complete len:173 (-) Transcript_15107:121-639(-)|eukprot:CAMPEP_0197300930 /NCGR_PEP_ID=MMETSP0890-20130614/49517_1 /TAXON_ID=44058 ORGANISM="Aureoumbra lagunensis, Strain CCMP1510" /NCGR_SAMPLE_ID=MMETSP0890 /ASSEMBLY_ACC=CAM_ASM_000533 /LENGTH=172 /DNA_ID=CAMNT_0042780041 /DNA_START=44 /DNA_END=562 /DNA_ORIENTATION=-